MEDALMNLVAFTLTTMFVIIIFVIVPGVIFAATTAVVITLAYLPILAVSSLIFVLPSTRRTKRNNSAPSRLPSPSAAPAHRKD